jgi:regulatory protein
MPRKPPSRSQPVSVYVKALALLARRVHSARELKSKLARRGLDAGESAAALEKLQSKDFQNDARFGEMLVRSRIAGGYGPRWISAELNTHGISDQAAQALVDAAEPDWLELARNLLRRRYARPAATLGERAKYAAFLLRRGFDASTARLAVGNGGSSRLPDEAD